MEDEAGIPRDRFFKILENCFETELANGSFFEAQFRNKCNLEPVDLVIGNISAFAGTFTSGVFCNSCWWLLKPCFHNLNAKLLEQDLRNTSVFIKHC